MSAFANCIEIRRDFCYDGHNDVSAQEGRLDHVCKKRQNRIFEKDSIAGGGDGIASPACCGDALDRQCKKLAGHIGDPCRGAL